MKNAHSTRNNVINQQLTEAIKYWDHVSPVVRHPRTDNDYNKLVSFLDRLLDMTGGKENHKLSGLIESISHLIAAYEAEHHPAPEIKGIEALRFLMEDHQLKQSDLPEIGSQGVVSEILSGKRRLNARQIKLLAKRFHVDPSTFIDLDDL
jgi:HTH-type transcriptional regulator/antitoxin HigA